MKRMILTLTASILATSILFAEAPKFTKKPAATIEGHGAVVAFAVDRETDVAVFVEDAKGAIVRHLAAGVLGTNAPAPLKPGSLEQSLTWDGKGDYGKPAGPGPFKVRVALGVGARYDRIIADEPQNFGNIKALAVGPAGILYVCSSFGGAVANWSGERILALDRDGRYLRTVMPFASNIRREEAASLGVVEIEGRVAPLVKAVIPRSFYGSEAFRKDGMAVTSDGVILRPVGGYNARGPMSLSAISLKGTAPWGADVGPALLDMKRPYYNRPFVCVSSGGQFAYITGTGEVRPGQKPDRVDFSCVWRVALPVKGVMTAFFGKPEEAGSDDTHLSTVIRGLAVDGKGHLLVADHANNRVIVVSEKDTRLVGQFAVAKPDSIAVDPATGAVYVTRHAGGDGTMELVKFSGYADAREVAKFRLKGEGDSRHPWVTALDATTRPPIIWAGGDRGSLMRIEDQGERFEAKKINTGKMGACSFLDISVDRFRPDREIYARVGAGRWIRFNESTDKMEQVHTGTAVNEGVCILPGPEGNLYGPAYAHNLFKFNRAGKPIPWREGYTGYTEESVGKGGKVQKWSGPAHAIFVPVSMVFMTHTLGIRHDGRLFMFEPGHPGDRPPKMLREYTRDGKRVSDTPIIWKVSDAAIGPRFDPQGNIYIAEQIKPLDQPYPQEFAEVVGKVEPGKSYFQGKPVKDSVCTIYGSIVKFSPKGGMIHYGGENPFKGEPKLDSSLKTEEMGYYTGYRFHKVKITGAEWVRMGISHMDLHYCNCENTRFDVDEFGRVWYPDLGRFRVSVLDTAGNAITHFGGYGNAESSGPDSPVVDPKTGRLRSRQKEDPKTLTSPFVEPEIAFSWLVGVGVTDKYVYMGDSMNRRLLRAKLLYAAEETVDVQ